MGLGRVAIATLPSVIFPKLMFSDRLGGGSVVLILAVNYNTLIYYANLEI